MADASTDKMSIYIPQGKRKKELMGRLLRLAEQRDRSVNYLVVEAISTYLDSQEVAKKK